MKAALVPWRLRPQRLVGDHLPGPVEAVGHLGAVQAQNHAMSLWSIGRRCGAVQSDVEDALGREDVVRTHVLRPTWHHVLREDLGDLLEVTAPRIERLMASTNRAQGLTPERLRTGADVVAEAVRTEGPLTRDAIAVRLDEAGFAHTGIPLAHQVMYAEITGRIAGRTVAGPQHHYVAASTVPSKRTPRERLAWLATTYARGHSPFRDRDLAWWASLTLTAARQAIAAADLRPVEIAGETYVTDGEPELTPVPRALLLPNFDELISYARDPEDTVHLDAPDRLMRATGLVLVDGRVEGTWSRTVRASTVVVDVSLPAPPHAQVRSGIESEAWALARFLDREAVVRITS